MSGGPRFVVAGSLAASASAATITPALPTPASLINAHGLLLSIVTVRSNAVISTATPGWVKLYQDNSTANFTVGAFIAPGGSAAPAYTWAGAVNCAALVAFYDDTGQPIVQNAVGATSTASGTGVGTSSPSLNTTRNESVVVYYNGKDVATTLATPAGWTEDADLNNGTAGKTITLGSKAIPTSGSASGAISAAAALSANWVQRQVELLIATLPANFYSVEFEVAPLSRIGTGFESAEFEIAPLSRIGTGFESAEFEVAPLSRISTGFESAEFEVVALLVEGVEPDPPIPVVTNLVRSWGFSLDGNDFYCLRLGADTTLVYNLTSGTWQEWKDVDESYWRAHLGANWTNAAPPLTYTPGDPTSIIAGDDREGVLWALDPSLGYDEDTDGTAKAPFERVYTGMIPQRGLSVQNNTGVYVAFGLQDASFGSVTALLETSDDNGNTFVPQGTVTVAAGGFEDELPWRSLGMIKAPGRVFRFTDSGASLRIDAVNVRLGKDQE